MNYSGFKRSEWISRTNREHRSQMRKILQCKTKGEKENLESHYGTRFSVLTELCYYDSIKMAVVDPMHNLFLGKSSICLWICCYYQKQNIDIWHCHYL